MEHFEEPSTSSSGLFFSFSGSRSHSLITVSLTMVCSHVLTPSWPVESFHNHMSNSWDSNTQADATAERKLQCISFRAIILKMLMFLCYSFKLWGDSAFSLSLAVLIATSRKHALH